MEIKITVNVGGNDPIEVKVDVPVKEECAIVHNKPNRELGVDAKWFDERSVGWTKNAETNKLFLLQQQNFCNEKLRARGYLFLNEVYDALGMSRTRRGQCVGWVYDEDNPVGDNYVDFGLYEDRNADFINGKTSRALLDFNVDGDILMYL